VQFFSLESVVEVFPFFCWNIRGNAVSYGVRGLLAFFFGASSSGTILVMLTDAGLVFEFLCKNDTPPCLSSLVPPYPYQILFKDTPPFANHRSASEFRTR